MSEEEELFGATMELKKKEDAYMAACEKAALAKVAAAMAKDGYQAEVKQAKHMPQPLLLDRLSKLAQEASRSFNDADDAAQKALVELVSAKKRMAKAGGEFERAVEAKLAKEAR